MKKIYVFAAFASILYACTPKSLPVETPPPPPPAETELKTALDSFSYAVGMSISMQYREWGVKQLNTEAVMRGVNDVLQQKKPAFTADQANFVLNNYINQMMAEQAAENRKAGEAFLQANKTKPGVRTLPSGLQYQVIREGTGRIPTVSDTVTVHYTGTLTDGTVFDSSVDRGEPATFTVGGVIRGWTEALQLMKEGSRWRLFIPADLAYGNYSPPGSKIPAGAVLIFDVELIHVGGQW
ncbi:MAG TPA: FKBP-type peptidyl-prolyl cis-trans isomerase [Chitinophagaceae bacterium]